MPWHEAIHAEIAVEFQGLTGSMWDAWGMWCPTRDEKARAADAKAETARRAAVLRAVGKVSEARRIESYQRAWKRRRASKPEGKTR